MSEDIKEHPLGADTHIEISPPAITGIDYSITKWKLEIYSSASKKAILEFDGKGTYKSTGPIQVNGQVISGIINLFIKSSEVEWGKGELKGQMTIYYNNSAFEDSTQVIKTYVCDLGIIIV